MADPVDLLSPLFGSALVRAFGAEVESVDPAIRTSAHADYQVNAALALAKRLKKPPRDVAQAIVAALAEDPEAMKAVERSEIAGPGFINVWLKNEFLSAELRRVANGALGIVACSSPETVVIDYSSPNVAKEMHVGHLRSTIIGDALARAIESLGHKLIRQNHLGDWGTQFGMLIEHMLDTGGASSDDARESPTGGHSISDLNEFYRAAREKFDSDPAFAERARHRVVELQSGDAETLAAWRGLREASVRYLESVYRLLGVTLTSSDLAGESMYNPMLAEVVAELEKKGLAVVDEGAVCVFPPGFSGREGEPLPLIIKKKDGGYGYATTDLAAVRYRVQKLGATRLIYVVGTPQAQHLAMLFKAAELAGWLVPPVRAAHVGFGSVLGSDKKMFKTRAGETVRLTDLLEEAVSRAKAIVEGKNPDLPPDERDQIAKAVGIGAVKYADLSSDRVKDYVFDWDRMLAFDGNTAPYLQYAHARCRSIGRKAEIPVPPPECLSIDAPQERALAMKLLAFPRVVAHVADTLEPHHLCGYLYELSTVFSDFFENCPVLRAPSEAERNSRLALVDLTARVIARGLDLLGIEAPERM